MEKGDLLWMDTLPGGVCIFLRELESWTENPDVVSPILEYEVYHPTLGIFTDSALYFSPLASHNERIDTAIKNLSDYLETN
tara:strand:- start:359 stop:601 length:243 start_codon:yes stop_codon:yes gene_type:complete